VFAGNVFIGSHMTPILKKNKHAKLYTQAASRKFQFFIQKNFHVFIIMKIFSLSELKQPIKIVFDDISDYKIAP
jgi:hypothetical protein